MSSIKKDNCKDSPKRAMFVQTENLYSGRDRSGTARPPGLSRSAVRRRRKKPPQQLEQDYPYFLDAGGFG
jgi:hypothetical protein